MKKSGSGSLLKMFLGDERKLERFIKNVSEVDALEGEVTR